MLAHQCRVENRYCFTPAIARQCKVGVLRRQQGTQNTPLISADICKAVDVALVLHDLCSPWFPFKDNANGKAPHVVSPL